jgi:hypothetical protein
MLEEAGVIGTAEGNKPRPVLAREESDDSFGDDHERDVFAGSPDDESQRDGDFPSAGRQW